MLDIAKAVDGSTNRLQAMKAVFKVIFQDICCPPPPPPREGRAITSTPRPLEKSYSIPDLLSPNIAFRPSRADRTFSSNIALRPLHFR